jgi:hypothetical protein
MPCPSHPPWLDWNPICTYIWIYEFAKQWIYCSRIQLFLCKRYIDFSTEETILCVDTAPLGRCSCNVSSEDKHLPLTIFVLILRTLRNP